MAPISDTMSLLRRHFEDDNLRLFCHVLTVSHFSFTGKLYEQIYGVTVGSPLSPAIANFFLEDLEKTTLNRAAHKPLLFPLRGRHLGHLAHGPDRLRDFLDHLNSVHQNV
jgi:retron-type reverse transcriptase